MVFGGRETPLPRVRERSSPLKSPYMVRGPGHRVPRSPLAPRRWLGACVARASAIAFVLSRSRDMPGWVVNNPSNKSGRQAPTARPQPQGSFPNPACVATVSYHTYDKLQFQNNIYSTWLFHLFDDSIPWRSLVPAPSSPASARDSPCQRGRCSGLRDLLGLRAFLGSPHGWELHRARSGPHRGGGEQQRMG